MQSNARGPRRTYDYVKRFLDPITASVLLIITLPIQLVIALMVAKKLGRPVLFKQQRPGLNGKVFSLFKFRSMKDLDAAKNLVSDQDRLTDFGKKLRATSLDELPSLWNVIRGDMSLVGPRPLLVNYLERYTPEQARRHEVKPGITGLAQIEGRNSLSWEEKFDRDLYYVNNRSLKLDSRILLATLAVVFRRRGVNSSEHATMPEFHGDSSQ